MHLTTPAFNPDEENRLLFCHFCERDTLHTAVSLPPEETEAEQAPGELLRCLQCEAFTFH